MFFHCKRYVVDLVKVVWGEGEYEYTCSSEFTGQKTITAKEEDLLPEYVVTEVGRLVRYVSYSMSHVKNSLFRL